MERLRLVDLRKPLARVLNVCSTNPSIAVYASEAQRRLVAKGKWRGTLQRYRICTTAEGCISWPAEIDTIEAFWVCNSPGTVRNNWFEASESGPGLLTGETSYWNTLVDRGTLPTFDTMTGITSKVAVKTDLAETAGAKILIQGWNQLGEWIRTEDSPGVWIDGENVLLSTTTQYTTNLFSSITAVIKPVTKGPVRMWSYDTVAPNTVRAIAYYEPWEEVPIYRASLIPGLQYKHGCPSYSCESCSSDSTQVTVIAKLRAIKVVNDNDFLILGNLGAIKLMVMAILKEERNLFDESIAYEKKAIAELQTELLSYEGDGAIPTIKQEGRDSYGGGALNALTLGWPLTY